MQLFAIDINSRNVVADRLRAVPCDYRAPAGYIWFFGSWLDPKAACEAFDEEAGLTITGTFGEEEAQPGGQAPSDLQPRGGAG